MTIPRKKEAEYYELKALVDNYNHTIDVLEAKGMVVGYEYDGHMELGYNSHEGNFYVNVAY